MYYVLDRIADIMLQDIDFVCVETQVGDGSKRDCEVVDILETVEVQL